MTDFIIIKVFFLAYGHLESIAIVVIGTGHIIHFLRDVTAAIKHQKHWLDAIVDALRNIAE